MKCGNPIPEVSNYRCYQYQGKVIINGTFDSSDDAIESLTVLLESLKRLKDNEQQECESPRNGDSPGSL